MGRTCNNIKRLDPGFPGCQLLGTTREPVREAHADQSIIILHAKVAQKSYGNEKRCAAGYGDAVYRLCGYMCLDTSTQSQADTFKLMFDEQPNSRMFACAKSLFISDQDKRKHFRLLLRLFLGNRQEVGSFQSRMIKVISKPSQKRQSMKNADLEGQRADQGDFVLSEGFICYGCVVQLVCTESGLALPPMIGSVLWLWSTLKVIRKVNKQYAILDVDEPVSQLHKCAFQFRDIPHAYCVSPMTTSSSTRSGCLTLTLSSSPFLLVLRLFHLPSLTTSCLSSNISSTLKASCSIRDPSRVILNDGSCWTIIGVETVEFTFNQGVACIQTPVTPFPVITGLEVNGGGHVAMLEIHGENFSPHLKVWFGNSEAETMFNSALQKFDIQASHHMTHPKPKPISDVKIHLRSHTRGSEASSASVSGYKQLTTRFCKHPPSLCSAEERSLIGPCLSLLRSPKSLLCVVPDVSVFNGGWRSLRRVITVPLSLIRMDGLIYRTSFSFTYTPEIQPSALVRGGGGGGGGRREGGAGGGHEDDVLLETIHQEFTRANFHLFIFMGKTDEIQIKAKATASTTCCIQSLDRSSLCDQNMTIRNWMLDPEVAPVLDETATKRFGPKFSTSNGIKEPTV
ncbi:hypothetical protein INR49_000182 [Caranx melampygus]|nr:hypothetical protein INR49_000182 [Caranx melampygus]